MPNWLKEEIIKNKAAITKSSLEHSREQAQSIDDEGVDKSFTKGDQADSKSVDSSRSTEEEDDDDEVHFFLFYLMILRFSFKDFLLILLYNYQTAYKFTLAFGFFALCRIMWKRLELQQLTRK